MSREYAFLETNCNSSLSVYQECHRKWYYKYVLRLAKKYKPAPLFQGTIVHIGLEHLDKGIDEAVRIAKVEYDKSCIEVEEEERDFIWPASELMLRIYAETYKQDEIVTLLTEFSFSVELVDTETGKIYLYRGTIDRVGKIRGSIYVLEQKTSGLAPSTFFMGFGMDRQVTGYYLGVVKENLPEPIAGVIVDALFKPRTKKDGTPGVAPLPQREVFMRDKEAIESFVVETILLYKEIESLPNDDMEKWYKNPASCSKWGRRCSYFDICKYGLDVAQSLFQITPLQEMPNGDIEDTTQYLQQPRLP